MPLEPVMPGQPKEEVIHWQWTGRTSAERVKNRNCQTLKFPSADLFNPARKPTPTTHAYRSHY